MKLCRKGRDELREEVVKLLNNVPYGKRITLDNNLLEELLFEEVLLNKETGVKMKIPVWSGVFLRKLDLNGVNFDDVSWSFLADEQNDLGSIYEKINIDNDGCDRVDVLYSAYHKYFSGLPDGFVVDYSKTNANIDLASSFEAKHGNFVMLKRCNFSGVDFFCQDFIGVDNLIVFLSDLSGTKLDIPNDVKVKGYRSNFSGLDLSSRSIDAVSFFPEDEHYDFGLCNLCNTGINIKLDSKLIKENSLVELMKKTMNESWVGCFINGVKVDSSSVRKERALKRKEEYENMKSSILNAIRSSIDEQVKKMR